MAFSTVDEFFKTDFAKAFDFFEKIEENIKNVKEHLTENINDNICIYIDEDEDMIIEIPAIGIGEEDVSIELEDNILVVTAEIDKNEIIEVSDDKKFKETFKYDNIIKKIKLSDKYANGEFDVNINKGLIFIIITPKEVKPKSRKIF